MRVVSDSMRTVEQYGGVSIEIGEGQQFVLLLSMHAPLLARRGNISSRVGQGHKRS